MRPSLTAAESKLLFEGGARVGLTKEQCLRLVSQVVAGEGAVDDVLLPGFEALPRPKRVEREDVCLVLSYDPANPTSYSTGWGSKAQASAARLDGREIEAHFPELWWSVAPLLYRLPTRLALNLLVADIAHTGGSGSFVKACGQYGCLESQEAFETIGKRLSLASKGREGWLDNPAWFVELNVLVGCRYPDDESAKRVSDEIRASAPVERVPGPGAWECYRREAKRQRFKKANVTPGLREFINSLVWKTDGSASMSGLEGLKFTAKDAEGIIRLSKALVPFVTTLDELTGAVSNLAGCDEVIVKTVIKLGETSKDRVIYPYPLGPTIAKAYLLSHIRGLGNYPLSETYVTNRLWRTSLGESGWSEIFRHLRTLSLVSPDCANKAMSEAAPIFLLGSKDYGQPLEPAAVSGRPNLVCLASDVKGFDKQVGKTFSDEFWDAVREVVPALSWSRVSGTTTGSPYSELILPVDQELNYAAIKDRKRLERDNEFVRLISEAGGMLVPNLAYLTSGTLETTKVGNRVSYIACRVAAVIINKLYLGCVEMFDVRGGRPIGHAPWSD